jgi:hypothetical protein
MGAADLLQPILDESDQGIDCRLGVRQRRQQQVRSGRLEFFQGTRAGGDTAGSSAIELTGLEIEGVSPTTTERLSSM